MRSCVAYNCHNRGGKESKVSFFRFPIDNPKLLHKWLKILGRTYITHIKSSYLCSNHFDDDAFKPWTKTKRLKNDAVPSKLEYPSENLMKINKSKKANTNYGKKNTLKRVAKSAKEPAINCH